MATGHELAMRLRVAYLAMHRRTGAELARFGLTADQFVLLTALVEGDALTQKELVSRTCSDPNTMSEMLARLERRGLVVRERHATDGRARSVSLTAEGRRMQARLWRASDPLREALESLFPAPALRTLVRQLDRIASGMTDTLPQDAAGEPAGTDVRTPARGRRAVRRQTRRHAAAVKDG